MPKKLLDCVKKVEKSLKARGQKGSGWGICIKSLRDAGEIKWSEKRKEWVSASKELRVDEILERIGAKNDDFGAWYVDPGEADPLNVGVLEEDYSFYQAPEGVQESLPGKFDSLTQKQLLALVDDWRRMGVTTEKINEVVQSWLKAQKIPESRGIPKNPKEMSKMRTRYELERAVFSRKASDESYHERKLLNERLTYISNEAKKRGLSE